MDLLAVPPDVSAADWVVAGVRNFDHTVGSIIPTSFEAYARVFHPAERHEGDRPVDVRWAEVASANGTAMHPAAEWGSLTGSWQLREQPGLWSSAPRTGELPAKAAEDLAAVLGERTTSRERCWFALSALRGEPEVMMMFSEDTPADVEERVRNEWETRLAERRQLTKNAPQFELPDRPMRLLCGPAAALADLYELHEDPPNLWWPDDRAWCVGSEIDLMTTYVGASRATIEALLADDRLEALPVSIDQSVTWEADTINRLPGRPL